MTCTHGVEPIFFICKQWYRNNTDQIFKPNKNTSQLNTKTREHALFDDNNTRYDELFGLCGAVVTNSWKMKRGIVWSHARRPKTKRKDGNRGF